MKDVEGFEGLYAVTEDGRVWSHPRIVRLKNGRIRRLKGKFLSFCSDNHGYLVGVLSKEKTTCRILLHRLIAITFIPNPGRKEVVNHKNGIKSDNRVDNLEWCTRAENNSHAARMGLTARGTAVSSAKLDDDKVGEIRRLYASGAVTHAKLANLFSIDESNISRILGGKTWKHVQRQAA